MPARQTEIREINNIKRNFSKNYFKHQHKKWWCHCVKTTRNIECTSTSAGKCWLPPVPFNSVYSFGSHMQITCVMIISQYVTVPCEKIEPLFFLDYSANMYSRKKFKCHTGQSKHIARGFSVLWWIFSELFKKNKGSNFSQATVGCWSVVVFKKER